jgi:hypothetical protein
MLSGIDPILEDSQVKLLDSSAGSWDEALFPLQADPEAAALEACFARRLQLRRGLLGLSRCVISLPRQGRVRWELWAVHPYRSPYLTGEQ